MQSPSNIVDAFFTLLRAGLWEQGVRLFPYSPIDFDVLYKLAEEQSVIGLIAAGLEHVEDMTLQKQQVMPFMKQVLSLESRNASMNKFIESLITRINEAGIQALLVKGQGVAQCYERPMWRSAGDIDLLLDADNYEKAKTLLLPMASSTEKEEEVRRHLGMIIGSWNVELHGTLHCGLSERANKQIDRIQEEAFNKASFRIWQNGETVVLLPGIDEDVIFIFAHILQHFFRGGIGLRQICDWSRLLWKYRDSIDRTLLEQRISALGLMTEWKAFGAFIVDYLGMHIDALPLYDSASRWNRKARRTSSYILKVGNFGKSRDRSYYTYPYLLRKVRSFGRNLGDFLRHFAIAPTTSLRVFVQVVVKGVKKISQGR